MNNNESVGLFVDKDKMDAVVLDLYNKIDAVLSILNKIKYKVYDINDYFSGPVAEAYQKKINRLITQMPLIKDNLNTYAADLLEVKEMFLNIEKKNIAMIQSATSDSISRASKIEDKPVQTELIVDK